MTDFEDAPFEMCCFYGENTISIYLAEELQGIARYGSVLENIRNSSANTKIHITLSSVGGELATALAFHDAIRDSAADVEVVLCGVVASAAVFIPLKANTITAGTGSKILIHEPELVNSGALSQQAFTTLNKELYEECLGKLPRPMINAIFKGAEVVMSGNDFVALLSEEIDKDDFDIIAVLVDKRGEA